MPARSVILRLVKLFPQSLIAEIYRIFGIEDAEKFLTVFAGTTVRVTSTSELEDEERNLAIYETLRKSQSASESRRLGEMLCKQYKLKRSELRQVYRQTKRRLKDATSYLEADKRTGEHQISKRRKRNGKSK